MEIFSRKLGRGKPVLLLHGFCETQQIWNGFAERLSENFEVWAIDLPGFGDSKALPGPFSISDVAERIVGWVDEKEIRLPFVVGHSLGGYVALSMASLAPDQLAGLCLFQSTPYPDTEERKANRNRVIEFVKKNGVDSFIDTFVPGLFFDKMHPSIGWVDKMARTTSVDTLVGYAAAMRDRPSSVDFLRKYDRPVLTIAGEKDSIIDVKMAQEFGQLAGKSTFRMLPDTGHMAMIEQPDKARTILADFLLGL